MNIYSSINRRGSYQIPEYRMWQRGPRKISLGNTLIEDQQFFQIGPVKPGPGYSIGLPENHLIFRPLPMPSPIYESPPLVPLPAKEPIPYEQAIDESTIFPDAAPTFYQDNRKVLETAFAFGLAWAAVKFIRSVV